MLIKKKCDHEVERTYSRPFFQVLSADGKVTLFSYTHAGDKYIGFIGGCSSDYCINWCIRCAATGHEVVSGYECNYSRTFSEFFRRAKRILKGFRQHGLCDRVKLGG